jgi:histidyl-tRNA synthetase
LKTCGIGKQMEQANAAKCRAVVFVGGTEQAEGKVKIKTLSTGEEKTVPLDSLVEALK